MDVNVPESVYEEETPFHAYQNLSTLRNLCQFLGWLYVIANRLCLNWRRKQKPEKQLQSLEDTPMQVVVKSTYARYVLEQCETETTERSTLLGHFCGFSPPISRVKPNNILVRFQTFGHMRNRGMNFSSSVRTEFV